MDMVYASLTFGVIIWAGIIFIMVKMPRRLLLRTLNNCLVVDTAITVLTLWIHFGTVTGLMAAAVAGLITALSTSSARTLIGYHDGTFYYRGWISIKY